MRTAVWRWACAAAACRWLGVAALLAESATNAPPPALEKTASPAQAVTLRWENDAVAGNDENYSNGIALSYSREWKGLLGCLWSWLGVDEKAEHSCSYEVGQVMITPSDTDRKNPDPKDRPYAGMLHVAAATQVRWDNQFHGLKFVTGVAGPASLAGETQKWFHRLIGNDLPQGWDYQLENEPIFNLVYEYRRKYRILGEADGFSGELIPVAGGMLGNVLIQGQAGLRARLGFNIPDDFGGTLLRGFGNLPLPKAGAYDAEGRPRPAGFYVFASGGMMAVARNLSLDGNTFHHSRHVNKRPFVPAAELGCSLWTRWGQVTASYAAWGKEFDNQPRASSFGAIAVSVFF